MAADVTEGRFRLASPATANVLAIADVALFLAVLPLAAVTPAQAAITLGAVVTGTRHDAGTTIAALAARLQDAADPATVHAALLGAACQALQPERASVRAPRDPAWSPRRPPAVVPDPVIRMPLNAWPFLKVTYAVSAAWSSLQRDRSRPESRR